MPLECHSPLQPYHDLIAPPAGVARPAAPAASWRPRSACVLYDGVSQPPIGCTAVTIPGGASTQPTSAAWQHVPAYLWMKPAQQSALPPSRLEQPCMLRQSSLTLGCCLWDGKHT